MYLKLKKYIETNFPFLENSKLLIACSGGLDSVALVHLCKKLGLNFALAHCNFSLRGAESNEDELFVKELASVMAVSFFSERFDTKKYATDAKISTQMAARELRYTWFTAILEKEKFEYVLTAHHADDALETLLINLSRGSGLRGLIGIPSINGTIVRPLLPFSRNQILSFAKNENLYWREDSSNATTDYLRNKFRHTVLPVLKETSKDFLTSTLKTQKHLRESSFLIEDYMTLIYNLVVTQNDNGYAIDIQKLKELPNTQALLYELLFPFGFTDYDSIHDLLKSQTGKKVSSSTHQLLRNRNELLLTKIEEKEGDLTFFIKKNEVEILAPIHLRFIPTGKIGNIENTTIYIDGDLLTYPLKVRKWQEGDYFYPFGMKGKKKLSKFFKDEKLSLIAKEKTYLLCSNELIVWVIGLRLDNRFKVTEGTKNILKINLVN